MPTVVPASTHVSAILTHTKLSNSKHTVHYLLACCPDVWEHNECAGLVWPLWHSVVGSPADKPKGTLAANHQMFDDLNGVIQGEIHQGIEGVAGGALDGKFPTDQVGQLLVGLDTCSQVDNTINQVLVGLQVPGNNTSSVSIKQVHTTGRDLAR